MLALFFGNAHMKQAKWIFCTGMRRSGSTLQYHIVRELLPDAIDHAFLAIGALDELITQVDTTRVHIGKLHIGLLPQAPAAHAMLAAGNARAVHIYRNPLDAMASLKIFRHKIPSREVHAIYREHFYWSRAPYTYVSKYKHAVIDIAGEARNIAEFLGINKTEEEYARIASELAIRKQHERQPAKGYDSKQALWWNHINTGKNDIWRDVLTNYEVEMVSRIMETIIDKY